MKTNLMLIATAALFVCAPAFAATDGPTKPKKKVTHEKPEPPATSSLKLADGFRATVFAENLGKARHIAVDPATGTVFVKLDKLKNGKGIVELRDSNNDGQADQTTMFGTYPGTGAAVSNGYLYASADTAVFRYKLTNGKVAANAKPETIVTGIPLETQHASKSLTVSPDGRLFVNFGAPSNACQQQDRTQGSPGMDPCPILDEHGGIWVFDAARKNQRQSDGKRYATGIRNAVALDWNTANNTLYALQHGRDALATLFPKMYTDETSAELPNEEFLMVREGDDFGWPYCYNDSGLGKKVLAPEYGGDGKTEDRCAGKQKPIMAFPGHWAPNDLLFYTGDAFPARYKNGAFVCFHGSWNRAPLNQGGYFVAFIPFGKDGMPSGQYEVFAENFAGVPEQAEPGDHKDAGKLQLAGPADAKARPMGLAQAPDGSLYITDSVKGNVWKVAYAKSEE